MSLTMVLLEDQHRSQTDGTSATAANVHTDGLGLGQELVTVGGIPGNEGTLALSTEVLDVLGVLLGEALETSVEVVTGGGGVLNQVQTLDLLDDTAEDQSTGWVTDPGVELTVRLVGAQVRVTVVVTGSLGLLGESHDIWGSLEVPVVVGPELTGGTDTGLDLVDDQKDVVALGDLAQTAEELRRGVVVTTLRLDGLNDDSGNRVVEGLDDVLNFLKAALLLLSVLLRVLLKRVLESRERSLGPVKGRDIKLVDGLAAGGGQTAEETTVEGLLEGQNGQVRGTRELVHHGRGVLLLGELRIGSSTLTLTVPHERSLVGSLVGLRTRRASEHLVHALGSGLEETGLQDMSPVSGGEVTRSRSVDQGIDHLLGLGNLLEVGVVVSHRDRGNLGIAVDVSLYCHKRRPQLITYTSRSTFPSRSAMLLQVSSYLIPTPHLLSGVRRYILVTNRLGVVRQHVQASNIKNLIQFGDGLLVVGTGDLRLNLGTGGFIGEEWLRDSQMSGGAERAKGRDTNRRAQARGARAENGSHLENVSSNVQDLNS